MAGLLNVTRHTLVEWCDDIEGFEQSGCWRRGGNGIGYEFNPLATIWFLIRHFERVQAEEVDKLQKQRSLIAGDKLDSVPDEFTIKDSKDALALHLQIIAAEKDAAKLVDAEESHGLFNDLIIRLREECLSAPQKLDPTNEWEPEVREKFDSVLADLMLLLQESGIGFVREAEANGSVPRSLDGPGESAAERRAAY